MGPHEDVVPARSKSVERSRPTTGMPDQSKVVEFDAADEVVARREEQADLFVDVTADAAPLVSAERDALTVPGGDGETHRRRDQTAGVAAQEIAAEPVRARRNGEAGVVADLEE
jgi:hypothetical protein